MIFKFFEMYLYTSSVDGFKSPFILTWFVLSWSISTFAILAINKIAQMVSLNTGPP